MCEAMRISTKETHDNKSGRTGEGVEWRQGSELSSPPPQLFAPSRIETRGKGKSPDESFVNGWRGAARPNSNVPECEPIRISTKKNTNISQVTDHYFAMGGRGGPQLGGGKTQSVYTHPPLGEGGGTTITQWSGRVKQLRGVGGLSKWESGSDHPPLFSTFPSILAVDAVGLGERGRLALRW